jgi:hypothetical protein
MGLTRSGLGTPELLGSSNLSIDARRQRRQDRSVTPEPECSDQLAYTIDNFARAVDVSDWTIRQAIRSGELVARYPGKKKALITKIDGQRWLASLPTEPR